MTDKEYYQQLLDKVFGTGFVQIPNDRMSNNVIGALNYKGDFDEFKKNFEDRLVRLKNKFSGTPSLAHLKTTLKEVSNGKNANYTGAYAELPAFDTLQNNILTQPIEMDKNIAGVQSLASKFPNRSNTNADGYIPEYDVYFDIKRLADISRQLFDDIIRKAIEKTGVSNYLIAAEYNIDSDYRDYESNYRELLNELCTELKTNHSTYQSKVCNVLFRITDKGIVGTTSSYNSEIHAKHILHQMFKYSDKFLLDKPFFLVMVLFPWYNNIITEFSGMNKKFYENLSDSFFNGYKGKSDLMNTLLPTYLGNETIFEVTRKVTGIIYIEDKSILGDGGNQTQTSTFVYLNSNADNKAPQMQAYLQSLANSNAKGCLQWI